MCGLRTNIRLHNRIVRFLELVPNIETEGGRQALVFSAELDKSLENQISFEGTTNQFCQLLVHTLEQYGTLHDGRSALEAVLEAAKDMLGSDKEIIYRRLIAEMRNQTCNPIPYELVRLQEFDLTELVNQFTDSFWDRQGLIGFAVPLPFPSLEFLDIFCDRLIDEYRLERMDRYKSILDIDDYRPVPRAINIIKKKKGLLEKNDMLFGVKINSPHQAREFWFRLCQEFREETFEHSLVVIFAMGPDCTLPEEIIRLNSPHFSRAHVHSWVVNVIKSISRPGEINLANTVRSCIENFYSECCSKNDGELDIELVYAYLKEMSDFLE